MNLNLDPKKYHLKWSTVGSVASQCSRKDPAHTLTMYILLE